MVSIFKYSNYREFIRDYYQDRKYRLTGFSFRVLARKANINSSSFFKYIIEGKRNLSTNTMEKVGGALNLKGVELEYFKHLVLFNQSSSVNEKNFHFSHLTRIRNIQDTKIVDSQEYEFYSEWYHPIVRELVVLPGLNSAEAIAEVIEPNVSVASIQESMEMLLRLKFIKAKNNGEYEQSNPLLTSGKEVKYNALRQYQMKMLELAYKSLEQAVSGNYVASSSTFALSKKSFELGKDILRECRQALMNLAGQESSPERVFQMNVNLFPMSRTKEKLT